MLELGNVGTRERWNQGTLESGNIGTKERCNYGTLEQGKFGIRDSHIGTPLILSLDTVLDLLCWVYYYCYVYILHRSYIYIYF